MKATAHTPNFAAWRDVAAVKVSMTPEHFVKAKLRPQFGFDELKQLVDDEIANAK